jgi:glycosyltransferase involved in cell wall biosynthesis
MYWPVKEQMVPKLIEGHEEAEIVLFTGENNLRVMEKRLGHPITNSGIFYNPTGVERNIKIPYPISGEKLNIAIVGNLHNIHKGQQMAIELFAQQKWKNRPVHLNIYGIGQDEDEFKKQVHNLHLTNVTFCGYANELSEVWAQNHAILLSSYMEGLPIVLMSAMLCARVSIATDIGSHTEVISDNISGFIAAKPTVEALDEALERAWQRKDEWEAMGQLARTAILKFLPEDPMRFFLNRIELFSMNNISSENQSQNTSFMKKEI